MNKPNLSAPTPEAGPTVGASPVHGRTRRTLAKMARFALVIAAALVAGSLLASWLMAAAPDQSVDGAASLLLGLLVVAAVSVPVGSWLFQSAPAEAGEESR